jgi:hypothetical protein
LAGHIDEFPSDGIEGQFRTITLSLRLFHDKIETFSNVKNKGKGIGPKGAVQAPLT